MPDLFELYEGKQIKLVEAADLRSLKMRTRTNGGISYFDATEKHWPVHTVFSKAHVHSPSMVYGTSAEQPDGIQYRVEIPIVLIHAGLVNAFGGSRKNRKRSKKQSRRRR